MSLLALSLAAGGGAAATWLKMPRSGDLRGTVRFENLDRLPSDGARQEFEQTQRAAMTGDECRKLARTIYHSDMGKSSSDGFLDSNWSGSPDLASIAGGLHSQGDRVIVEINNSADPVDDRLRLRALLKALFTKDLEMRDAANFRAARIEAVRAELAARQARLDQMKVQIEAGRKKQEEFEQASKQEHDRSDRSAQLEKAWSDASADVKKLRVALEELASTPAPAPAQPAADDPELARMSARLKHLGDELEAARGARTFDAQGAAASLEAALVLFKQEIDKTKAAAPSGSALASYVATAAQVQAAIIQISIDLAEREKVSTKTITDLHGKIAEKIQAHLKRVWDNDPLLANLKQQQDIHVHMLGPVVAAGLTDDAARIRGQLDVDKAAVATRRDKLAISASYPDDIKSLERLASDQADEMAAERQRATQRMDEQFKILAEAAPKPGTLPLDQQKLLDGLIDPLVAVKTAARQTAAAADAVSQVDEKTMASDITDLKAQIEARNRQLADAAVRPAADSPAIAQIRTRLDAAQLVEARAFSDWTVAKNELATAQKALDRLQSPQAYLVGANLEKKELESQIADLKSRLARDTAIVPVIPTDPDHEEGVSITRSTDNRPLAEGGIGVGYVLAAGGFLLRARTRKVKDHGSAAQ